MSALALAEVHEEFEAEIALLKSRLRRTQICAANRLSALRRRGVLNCCVRALAAHASEERARREHDAATHDAARAVGVENYARRERNAATHDLARAVDVDHYRDRIDVLEAQLESFAARSLRAASLLATLSARLRDRDLLRRCFGRLALEVAARRAERIQHAEAREAVQTRLAAAEAHFKDALYSQRADHEVERGWHLLGQATLRPTRSTGAGSSAAARLRRAGVRVGDVQVRFMDRALLCAVWYALRRTVADGRAHRDREAWRVVVAQLTARVAQLEALPDAAAPSKAAEAG